MDNVEDIAKFINKKRKKAPTVLKLINFMATNDLTLNQLVKEWTNTPITLMKKRKGFCLALYPTPPEPGYRNLIVRCNKDCNNCKHSIKCALQNITGGEK
jgi:hypothetical protein